MKTDKDILKECSELKEMPFGVPEGYFESFRSRMTLRWRQKRAVTADFLHT